MSTLTTRDPGIVTGDDVKDTFLHVVCGKCGPRDRVAVCGYAVNDIFPDDGNMASVCVVCATYESAKKCPRCHAWWKQTR